MKPNTWYYTTDNGKTFHEKPEDMSGLNRNYTSFARTDENGEWVKFEQMGEVFDYATDSINS